MLQMRNIFTLNKTEEHGVVWCFIHGDNICTTYSAYDFRIISYSHPLVMVPVSWLGNLLSARLDPCGNEHCPHSAQKICKGRNDMIFREATLRKVPSLFFDRLWLLDISNMMISAVQWCKVYTVDQQLNHLPNTYIFFSLLFLMKRTVHLILITFFSMQIFPLSPVWATRRPGASETPSRRGLGTRGGVSHGGWGNGRNLRKRLIVYRTAECADDTITLHGSELKST